MATATAFANAVHDVASSTESGGSRHFFSKNMYSRELLRILYLDMEGLADVKRKDMHENLLDTALDPKSHDRSGVRALCVSPDGNWLASGDRAGNLR